MAKSVQEQVAAVLKEYEDAAVKEIAKITVDVAKDTRKILKQTSPKSNNSGKHYADGWAVKTEKSLTGGVGATVYNRTKPQLTHLLEKGHSKVGGGRVAAIPHIAPAEQRGIQEFIRKAETEL